VPTDNIVKHAAHILRSFEIEPRPLDRMLDEYYRGNRNIGSKDRQIISNTLFGIMRVKRRLDGVLQLEGIKNPTHVQRVTAFLESKHDLKADPDRFPGGPAAYWSYPDFIYDRLVKYRGKEWAATIVAALENEAKVVIRVNTLKIDRDKLQKILNSEGIESHLTDRSPFGLILSRRINLNSFKSFKDGLFEIQDEGSQLLGLLIDPKKDETVIDVCAGAGGKTLLIAMLMEGGGKIIASDINIRKLKILKGRARQAGVKNIKVVLANKLKEYYRDSADAVLIDAPCTGTGTLRRNPDLKWRLGESDIENCVKTQKEILADCTSLVKKGGRLIYATCSLLPDENEQVVDWFIKKFGWELAGDYFRTDPSKESMDGFFAAVIKRPSR